MRKKQLIKSMAIAMAGVLFASCAISASAASEINITGTGTTAQGAFSGTYTANLTADLENNPASIDVQAKTGGGAEIVYDLTVSWGKMQFEYDFGGQWDSRTHTYTLGTSGKQGGGWTAEGVDGTNNKITVKNDSNFPMTATFSFEMGDVLNADSTKTGAVVGIFSENNNAFVTTSGSSSSTNPILDAGYNNSNVISSMTMNSLDLEMVASELETGQKYYATASSVTSDVTTATKSMYFALSGRPDTGLQQSSLTSIGTLKVEVAPIRNATQLTK